MRGGGRTDKKNEIRTMVDEWPEQEWTAALHFLSGTYTSAGIGKKSAIEAVEMYDLVDDFEGKVGEAGTVSEALREADVSDVRVDTFGGRLTPTDSGSLDQLQTWIEDILSNESGDDQIATLGRMLMDFEQPHLVTFALLDDWQTGVTETTIANAIGEKYDESKDDIQRARALCPDPVEFARTAVAEGGVWPMLEPQPGQPFKPMKAKPESYLDDLLSRDTPIYTELKLDGYRMLIHVSNGEAEAYTRRLKDATASMPELQEIDWPDGEWIIDGEAMASDGSYTTTSEMVGSNQERSLGDRDEHVTFHAFDLLLDGEMGDQTEQRYEKRRAGLILFRNRIDTDFFDVVPAFGFKKDTDPVAQGLDYAEEHDFEGIIVKDGAAEYQFGKRSKSWVKQKNTAVTVDLVMSSFVEGERSNAGTLGAVELETADGQYVGKMGTGFTDAERDEIWQNRQQYMDETVEVTFEGLGTNSELRFPRMERLRVDDGEPDDFDRLMELAEQV
jgi:ATP-dependent DNA ligase